jgi:hypothetical protein
MVGDRYGEIHNSDCETTAANQIMTANISVSSESSSYFQ